MLPDRASSDQFGWSVAISGGYAIVGVYYEDEDASGENTLSAAGSIYLFKSVIVSTSSVSDIGVSSATVGGNVTEDEGTVVTERGDSC